MSTKYKIHNPEGIYYVTFATVQWVNLFDRPVYKHILVDNLNYCIQNKGLIIFAYVIMSNHLHLIMKARDGFNLSHILRDYKKYTSVKLLEEIQENPQESRKNWMLWIFGSAGKKNINNKKFQIWQQDNHPIELINNEIIDQKINYIHDNPVVAEYVINPEDYKYSSARDYADGHSDVNVELLK